MHVSISNCNDRMDWVATVGDESRTFPFRGKAYGAESKAAREAALAWIESHCATT